MALRIQIDWYIGTTSLIKLWKKCKAFNKETLIFVKVVYLYFRNCGRVYCGECTSFTIPVPQQQLNVPVRVCRQCYYNIKADNGVLSNGFFTGVYSNGMPPKEGTMASGSNGVHDSSYSVLSTQTLNNGSSPDSDTDKTTTPTCC